VNIDTPSLEHKASGKEKVLKHLFAVLVACFAIGLYYYFFVATARVEVELTVSQKADFKIYWAKEGELYSEKLMAGIVAKPERQHYTFFLTNISDLARLRIDTHNYQGEATLKKLRIVQEGYQPLILADSAQFGLLKPLQEIEESRVDEEGLWVSTSGSDGNFEWLVTPERSDFDYFWLFGRFAVVAVFVLAIYYGAAPLAANLRFVPVLLFGVWLLIIAMAGISKENSHPDEYVHMAAIRYYVDHWLPPQIDDPVIRDTFSVYGVSRLNNGEVYYLFAGKFHKFLQTMHLPESFSLRLFNVCLFGLIVLYAIRSRYARMAALPLLLSAQIWYIFCYSASDAFALFFAFLAACEAINPDSLLHRYLKGDGWGVRVAGALLLGLLLGIVFLLKVNYLPFVAFFYLLLIAKVFFGEEYFWDKKGAILRLMLVTLIGLGVYGARVGADYLVNGADRQAKMAAVQEQMAGPLYKPSTELHKKHISLYRQARGATLERIIQVDRWFEQVFRSSFGVFGYFTISGSEGYYNLVRWSGVFCLTLFFAMVFRGGGWLGGGLAVIALAIAAALIGKALHHSWTIDFQAQGRYLFPLLPIFGMLYGWHHQVISRRLMLLGVLPLFCLGIYVFIFEALVRIPRLVAM
jgi:hypothetical protein